MMQECNYNHTKNAGNVADVWKHDILLKVVKLLRPKMYFETHCGFPYYNKGNILLSSYMKVRLKHSCSMTICDINRNIANFIPPGMDLNFINVNGWEQIYKCPEHDLYFVDPPYVNLVNFILLDTLLSDESFKNPLAAWYPIFEDMHPGNYEFGLPKIEHKFNEGKLIGCGMVFKNISKNIVNEVQYAKELSTIS